MTVLYVGEPRKTRLMNEIGNKCYVDFSLPYRIYHTDVGVASDMEGGAEAVVLVEWMDRIFSTRERYRAFLNRARRIEVPVIAVLAQRQTLPDNNHGIDHIVRNHSDKSFKSLADGIGSYIFSAEDAKTKKVLYLGPRNQLGFMFAVSDAYTELSGNPSDVKYDLRGDEFISLLEDYDVLVLTRCDQSFFRGERNYYEFMRVAHANETPVIAVLEGSKWLPGPNYGINDVITEYQERRPTRSIAQEVHENIQTHDS